MRRSNHFVECSCFFVILGGKCLTWSVSMFWEILLAVGIVSAVALASSISAATPAERRYVIPPITTRDPGRVEM
jgi:hypothetical protein